LEEEEAALEVDFGQNVETKGPLVIDGGTSIDIDIGTEDYIDGDKVEMQSATGFDDLCKRPLYQIEGRDYHSVDPAALGDVSARQYSIPAEKVSAFHRKSSSVLGLSPRPVSVIDYNEYRKLEDKRERIILKRKLYDNKKSTDLKSVTDLDGKLGNKLQENDNLKKWVMELRDNLSKI